MFLTIRIVSRTKEEAYFQFRQGVEIVAMKAFSMERSECKAPKFNKQKQEGPQPDQEEKYVVQYEK